MTTLRALHGVSYWVIEDPSEIAELINSNVRKEWETDMAGHEDEQDRAWLDGLRRRTWSLETVNLGDVRLNERTMDYRDRRTGYVFRKELEKRVRVMKDQLGRFGMVIWPLVLRGEDHLLMDGYCRFHTLLELNSGEAYAYVGSLKP